MFFEGVIKAQTGDTRGAIALFEDMATSYPELPEPHNNLGVLYASKGELESQKRLRARYFDQPCLRCCP